MEHSFLYGPVNRLLVSLLGAPPAAKLSPGWRAFLFPDGEKIWLQDNVIMALLLFAVLAIVLVPASRKFRKRSPGWFQNLNEMIILALRDLIDDIVGHGAAKRYLPLLGAFTYFILISNLMGFFFFLTPPTSSFQTTLALAITSFIFFNAEGIREHGLGRYLKHFMGPILALGPILFIIEMVSVCVRIGSLSLRLVGNIGGEHLATGIFFGLAPIIVPWPMMLLGLIGAILQTFIFVILSTIYIAGAVAHEEH